MVLFSQDDNEYIPALLGDEDVEVNFWIFSDDQLSDIFVYCK